MQTLQPEEVEILTDFRSRLEQSKKTKEFMILSPKAYIEKRITEIISDKIPLQNSSFIDKKQEISQEDREKSEKSVEISKTKRNRLIVPSIKAFENNRNLRIESIETDYNENIFHTQNHKDPIINKENQAVSKKNDVSKEKKKRELSVEAKNAKKNLINKREEVKKVCNKK